MTTILWLLVFSVILLYFFNMQRQRITRDVPAFMRSRAKTVRIDQPVTTFDDVAGVDEAKQELMEVVEFLKCPQKFRPLGARIPHGVLLIGPPGTGKTLLARAVAGEAHVPFFSASGSEFVEMFVGVGAGRVRDLFNKAKQEAPSIIFIDELDALGRRRGPSSGSGSDEHDQTLNQILVEMDGFTTSEGVIVIAATNRPDTLDPALIRPGRFDRQVVLDVPDEQGRLQILKVRARGKRLDWTVDLSRLAGVTAGFTGADLANLLNEAAILAARRGRRTIGVPELEDALDRAIGGPERKSRIIGESDKARLAYHEVGHALIARLLPNLDVAHKLTVVPRSSLVDCIHLITRDERYLQSKTELEDVLVFLHGGNEAERLIFGEPSTRASRDLQRATDMAREMVTAYGMNAGLGPLALGTGGLAREQDFGEVVAEQIDGEVHALIRKAAGTARALLQEHRADLVALAEKLAAEETLETSAIDQIMSSQPPPFPQAAIDLSVAGDL